MYVLNFQNVRDPPPQGIWLTVLKKSRFFTVSTTESVSQALFDCYLTQSLKNHLIFHITLSRFPLLQCASNVTVIVVYGPIGYLRVYTPVLHAEPHCNTLPKGIFYIKHQTIYFSVLFIIKHGIGRILY